MIKRLAFILAIAMALLYLSAVTATPGSNPIVIGAGQSLGVYTTGRIEQLNAMNGYQFNNHAVAAQPYEALKRGTQVFTDSVAAGGVLVDVIHGESDHLQGDDQETYFNHLMEWQADYSDVLGAETPFITDQMSSLTRNCMVSPITMAQHEAAIVNPSIFLVGPKYQYEYSDDVHLTADSYEWLGAQHGKVMFHVLHGGGWRPLEPVSAAVAGDVITVERLDGSKTRFVARVVGVQKAEVCVSGVTVAGLAGRAGR